MTLVLYFLFTVFLLMINLYLSKNDIFSPSVITCAIWIAFPLLYILLNHNLPPIGDQFIYGITIWIFGFCFASNLTQFVLLKNNNNTVGTYQHREANKTIRNILLLISVLSFPFLAAYVYEVISSNGTGTWIQKLRQASLSNESYDPLYNLIWTLCYITELVYYDKKHKARVLIPLFLCLIRGIVFASKLHFLLIFVCTMTVLWYKKVIRVKHLILGIVVLMLFFIWFQSLREGKSDSAEDKNDFIVLYAVGHIAAFETVDSGTSEHWGENVFRVLYAISYKLGLSDIEPVDPILPFISQPLTTNTYTVLYPFYKDFGYLGILLFSLLEGSVFGFIYSKMRQGSTYALIIYAYATLYIVQQYVAEGLLYNLAGFIKLCLIVAIPFVFTMKKQSHTTTKELLSSNKYPMPNTN